MPVSNVLKEPTIFETIINFAGLFGILGVIGLVIAVIFISEKNKNLATELKKLQRAFDELDGQAKLIVRTDLELHRAQEELDKKIAGLVTLQKLTRMISTTLDEEEIFKKIDEKHLTEIGFDRAIAFIKNEKNNLSIKMSIGYAVEEAERIVQKIMLHPSIVDKIFHRNAIFSSLDTDKTSKEIPEFLHTLELASFICAPILQKNGVLGVMIFGCESSYTDLTEGDKDLVYVLASQIGQALENAKLFEETWRSHQELELKIQQRTKELTQALEEIKIISKRKSDFISAVSHELRTPLTSIKGYASIVAAGKLGELPLAAKERVEKINLHSDSLTQLINNLLDISRIESGRQELRLEPLNLKNLVDALGDMLAPPMKDKGIEWATDIASDFPAVRADKNQIERVFINLVGNSIKFTPNGGRITVRARVTNPEMVQISVSDTGLGIPEKDLDKIFEEFYRVDNEVNTKVKGTGLGLSLVKYIVEAHKGKLTVSSQANKGSTFSFTLPKA